MLRSLWHWWLKAEHGPDIAVAIGVVVMIVAYAVITAVALLS